MIASITEQVSPLSLWKSRIIVSRLESEPVLSSNEIGKLSLSYRVTCRGAFYVLYIIVFNLV